VNLETTAHEIAAKLHDSDYSIPESEVLDAVLDAADATGAEPEELWAAVKLDLREHFYH
jgi:hypothetical protein